MTNSVFPTGLTRRSILKSTAATAALAVPATLGMPFLSRAADRPVITHGLQSGDVDTSSAMIWARADRPSRMHVEISTTEGFANPVPLQPLSALPETDFAVKRLLENLPADQDIFYRVSFADLADPSILSEPMVGHLRTAPASRRSVKFAWSGDTAGQGWGIDVDRGGMTTYARIADNRPDFFIHSGDTIYADGPIAAEKEMPDGDIWRSLVAEGVHKVAETLDEFRGRWKYNLLDHNVQSLNAAVPTFYQWDDHEVINNWSASKDLRDDDRYTEKAIGVLSARSGRAFHEMMPVRFAPAEPGRVYRKVSYGPLLDVFFVDLRTYRGPNGTSMEDALSPQARILGEAQVRWLKTELLNSRATWKVIASDMPLGLVVWDNTADGRRVEAVANGDDGAPRGRELEIADLLRFMKTADIDNVVWLTADVHYTAAHYYDPSRAQFQDFEPFWEFVSGPLHAGTFGPNELDATFGPQVRYVKAPTEEQGANLPPSFGLQFFGIVEIDGTSERMTVHLKDSTDTTLFTQVLDPVRRA